jgi:hypothetical protein
LAANPQAATGSGPGRGLDRLELRIERLKITFRFTFAFHAREVRFEADSGEGYRRIFPETFSFHVHRHDPAELFLQLDDLLRKSRLLDGRAHRRDARALVQRLLSAVASYLDRLCDRLEEPGGLEGSARVRFHQDVALLAQIFLRFLETRDLDEARPLRVAGHALRRRIFRSLLIVMHDRVDADYLERYVRREVDPVDPHDDPSESGFFHTLETGEPEVVNRIVVRMADRAFYQWLEGVCLDEENFAFEKEDSPFGDRESEVLAAITWDGSGELHRGEDFTPFLRRGDRDCLRLLKKLERWFLRQYDIRHSSSVIHHAAVLERGGNDGQELLTWHTPRIHVAVLTLLASPFILAALAYERAPDLFDLLCSLEIIGVNMVVIWFLLYRFCWKRDLSFFNASVPRIGAGIIVGYLPVFLIDEIWDLASRSALVLGMLVTFLALVTLLYIYVEVRHRLSDARVAFDRARGIFLLGVLQATGVGVMMTSLIGRFMVSRNWSPIAEEVSAERLQATLDPLLGQLPKIIGIDPLFAFPSALLLMIFLSFFIGVFLQLMWEELPITEPL